MTVNIYADEMVIINFIVNVLIIEFTKRVVKRRVSVFKESITAFLVAVIYTVVLISDLRVYINVFTILLMNTIELVILFKPESIRECIKCSIAFKIVSLSTNSCMLLLNSYLKNKFSFILLMISFGVTYFSYIVLSMLTKEVSYYPIDIKWSDKIINIKALVDNGNYLVEPISKKPVIVAEYSALKEFLPKGLIEIYEKKKESNLMEIISAVSEERFRNNLRVIPFKSVGKEKGLMIGFVADSVKIKNNVINKPIIGICRFNLSKNGLYSALISPRHLGGL